MTFTQRRNGPSQAPAPRVTDTDTFVWYAPDEAHAIRLSLTRGALRVRCPRCGMGLIRHPVTSPRGGQPFDAFICQGCLRSVVLEV